MADSMKYTSDHPEVYLMPRHRAPDVCSRRTNAPWLVVVFCVVAVFVLSTGGVRHAHAAGGLELGNLILDNLAGNITVRFGVRVDQLEELEQVLAEGSTVGLVCEGGVSRRKSMWPDKTLAEEEWVSTLRRDVLAQDYVLDLPGAEKALRSKDLAALLKDGWGRLSMVIGPWAALSPGGEYSLDLSITLTRRDVPVWLRYVVFFKSWDVYQPVSYQLDFRY